MTCDSGALCDGLVPGRHGWKSPGYRKRGRRKGQAWGGGGAKTRPLPCPGPGWLRGAHLCDCTSLAPASTSQPGGGEVKIPRLTGLASPPPTSTSRGGIPLPPMKAWAEGVKAEERSRGSALSGLWASPPPLPPTPPRLRLTALRSAGSPATRRAGSTRSPGRLCSARLSLWLNLSIKCFFIRMMNAWRKKPSLWL